MDMHNEHEELTPRDRAFEQQLQQAMSRVNAPASLEVALMNMAEAETERENRQKAEHKRSRILAFPRMRLWYGGAVAAVLAVGVVSLEGVHVHRERERAVATQQFEEAQQITDRTLEETRERLASKGIYLAQ